MKQIRQRSFDQASFGERAEGTLPAPLRRSNGRVNFPSAWQYERAHRLHRVCLCIKSRVARGQLFLKAARIFSRRWNGRILNSDPHRKYSLHISTLYRLYRAWRLAGESPEAFRLRYFPGGRRIPAPVLIRFINLVATQEFPSFKSAWNSFCRRGGNHGPGRVGRRPLKLGYDALRYNLPRGGWKALKDQHIAARYARVEIARLRAQFIAEIRVYVPDRLPRRRREVDFQI